MKVRDIFRIRKAVKAVTRTKEKIVAERLRLGKGLLRSKTFWVNLFTGAASVLGAVGGISVMPAAAGPYFVGALAFVNIFLRILTKEPVTSVK